MRKKQLKYGGSAVIAIDAILGPWRKHEGAGLVGYHQSRTHTPFHKTTGRAVFHQESADLLLEHLQTGDMTTQHLNMTNQDIKEAAVENLLNQTM